MAKARGTQQKPWIVSCHGPPIQQFVHNTLRRARERQATLDYKLRCILVICNSTFRQHAHTLQIEAHILQIEAHTLQSEPLS